MSTPFVNPLRARLAAGKPCAGMLQSMPSVHMTQLLAAGGLDWLFIDMEHGPIDIESAHAMIAATAGTACAPLVRVPWNLHWLVKPALDAGAMGIIFPMIRSAEEAEAAVRAMRYPPAGERGFGPLYAAPRFGTPLAGYVAEAERELLCVLLIEHRDAVEDIERIVAVEGVDVCLIAPFDLAMSYGHHDGPQHAEVQDGIARVEAVVQQAGLHLGGLALDGEAARAMVARGYRLIIAGIDAMAITSLTGQMCAAVHGDA